MPLESRATVNYPTRTERPIQAASSNTDFETIRKSLNDSIQSRAKITCKITDEHGQPEKEGYKDSYCPEWMLAEVFEAHERDLHALLSGGDLHNAQHPEEGVRTTLDGLEPYRKILAILLAAHVEPSSVAWQNLRDWCAKPAHDLSDATNLQLPILYQDLESFVELSQRDAVFMEQFFFCPVKLEEGKMIDLSSFEELRLPLRERRWLGRGTSGEVHEVTISKGYLDEHDDKVLAMKVLRRESNNYREWSSASALNDQVLQSRAIMMPSASLITKSYIYLFMPKADCNLHWFMEVEPGPRNFAEQIDRLRPVHDLALSLQHLHGNLWAEKGGTKSACIHGDLKASNILYMNDEFGQPGGFPLRIADFGVSTFYYSPKDSSDDTDRTRLVMPRIARGCTNWPPEAEDNGEVNEKIDTWGFGTFFAEYVAWISGGKEAYKSFREARRRGKSVDQALYFETHAETDLEAKETRLKPSVVMWFENLIETTHNAEQKKLYTACWDLIQNVLLVCNPTQRGRMKQVAKELTRILQNELGLENSPERPPSAEEEVLSSGSKDTTRFGADAPATTLEQERRNRHFQRAVKNRKPSEAVQYAMQGDDVRMDDDSGWTALHFSLTCNDDVLLRHLLKYHNYLLDEVDKDDETVLHKCIDREKRLAVKFARLIFDEGGKRISPKKNRHGHTALQKARRYENLHADMIPLLERHTHG